MREKARSSRSSSKKEGPTAHPDSSLIVGRVGRAVGLKGEVDVLIISDDPDRFAPGAIVFTQDGRELTVRTLRRQGERTIVSFVEADDRTGAEALRGSELVVPIERARALEEGEYWDHELLGCSVVTTNGDAAGVVVDVLHQPANEVLVVEFEGEQALVPLVAAVVKSVEPGQRITISPLPGLLEK